VASIRVDRSSSLGHCHPRSGVAEEHLLRWGGWYQCYSWRL